MKHDLDYAVAANQNHVHRVSTWTENGENFFAIHIDGVLRDSGSLDAPLPDEQT